MFSKTTIVILLCVLAANIAALEHCPGASDDSYEDLGWKYTASPIVAYGTPISTTKDILTFKVSCTLKGQLNTMTLELTQTGEVANLTECHYMMVNKNYIIFLESATTTTTGVDSKNAYRLAKMEEIEVNSNTAKKFLDDECSDTEDYGIEMTIFYTDANNKCDRFTAVCSEQNRASILALEYSPLDKKSMILGGMKKKLDVPASDLVDHIDVNTGERISGKNRGGMGDEILRKSNGIIIEMMLPMIMFAATLALLRHI